MVCRQDAMRCICDDCMQVMCEKHSKMVGLDCAQIEVCVYSVSAYHSIFKKLLAKLKFNHDVRLADAFAILLDIWWQNIPDALADVDKIIPVPIHARRYRYRGFNQSELILQCTQLIDHNLFDFKGIYRNRYTAPQSKSSKTQRAEQLKQVFSQRHPIYAKHLLIFDDVFTTGSTVRCLIDALMANSDNQIEKISVLALAKVQED